MAATALKTQNALNAASTTACAKINLTLEVMGLRGDNYHELRSLVIGVALHDRIRCVFRREHGINQTSNVPDLNHPSNLAVRAAEALAAFNSVGVGVSIELHKSIPIGGGLGGGSSDAATTLQLCNQLWGLLNDDGTLAAIGAKIGSDVPLFFHLPAAVMTGRGEQVRPVDLAWSGWVLLVHGPWVVSTPQVYRAWRASDRRTRTAPNLELICKADSADVLTPMLFNDLEPAVRRVCPAMGTLMDRLDRDLGPMRISGAGSTLYRIFDDEEAARDAARFIECQMVDATTTVVAGPVGRSPICVEGV